jgi:hypothetical protein
MGGFSVIGIVNRLNNFQSQLRIAGTVLTLPWKEIIGAALLVMSVSAQTKKQIRFLSMAMVSVSLFFLAGLGSRTYVFMCMFPSLAVLIDRGIIRIGRTASVLLIAFIIIMISPWFTNYRNYLIQGINPSILPPSAWAFSKGELGGQFQVAIKVFENHGWWYGADPSYLTAVLYSLPKQVYTFLTGHSKPLDLADWYSATYYTYMWFHSGVGWGFSPVIQAWMNGGVGVILLVFALLGLLVGGVRRRSWFSYVLLPQLIWFNRVDFHSFFYEVLLVSVFTFLILLVSRTIDSKKCSVNRSSQEVSCVNSGLLNG